MAPKKDRNGKRKVVDEADDTTAATSTSAGTSSKSAKLTKLTVSGVQELKKKLKSKTNSTIEELEIKADGEGNNTVEIFAGGLAEIRKLLPNLKSLSLDASEERDECEAKVLQNIFKTWEGSKTLESISLHMDWVQFEGLDQVLTGFSKADCTKLKKSLATTKNIPTAKFKKGKYSLASLPGLKKLRLIMCDVERIDDDHPPSFNKRKFEMITSALDRYLFKKMKKLEVDIKLLDDIDEDSEDYSDEGSEGTGTGEDSDDNEDYDSWLG